MPFKEAGADPAPPCCPPAPPSASGSAPSPPPPASSLALWNFSAAAPGSPGRSRVSPARLSFCSAPGRRRSKGSRISPGCVSPEAKRGRRPATRGRERFSLRRARSGGGGGTHDELPVLLLQALVALSQLVGHQLVLVALLLTGVQLLGQDEQSVLLALQLPFAHQELRTETSPALSYGSGQEKGRRRRSWRSDQRQVTKSGSSR